MGSRANRNQAREASDIIARASIRGKQIYIAPLGSGSDIATLPTACAVGYKHFVGFANSSNVNSDKRGSNQTGG